MSGNLRRYSNVIKSETACWNLQITFSQTRLLFFFMWFLEGSVISNYDYSHIAQRHYISEHNIGDILYILLREQTFISSVLFPSRLPLDCIHLSTQWDLIFQLLQQYLELHGDDPTSYSNLVHSILSSPPPLNWYLSLEEMKVEHYFPEGKRVFIHF